MDWKNNALGVFVSGNKQLTIEDAQSHDVIIAEVGKEFRNNVQIAYNHDKPVIMFAPHIITTWIVNHGFNEENWPTPDEDKFFTDPETGLDHWLLINGVMIRVHGIMLDCSYVRDERGINLTSSWFVARNNWVLKNTFDRYNLPVYMYMNKEPIRTFTEIEGQQGVISLLIRWGVSTVSMASTYDGIFPAPAEHPSLPYDDTLIVQWYFWLYEFIHFNMLYNDTKEALYEELSFVPLTIVPPAPEPDLTLEEKIDILYSRVEQIYDIITFHFKEPL